MPERPPAETAPEASPPERRPEPRETLVATATAAPDAEQRLRRRAHAITAGILGGTGAFIWLIWAHPMILLYGVLAVVAVMAYAAVYLMVTARLEDDESPPAPAPEPAHAPSSLEPPAAPAPLPPGDAGAG